jgi:hypothetical protein
MERDFTSVAMSTANSQTARYEALKLLTISKKILYILSKSTCGALFLGEGWLVQGFSQKQ